MAKSQYTTTAKQGKRRDWKNVPKPRPQGAPTIMRKTKGESKTIPNTIDNTIKDEFKADIQVNAINRNRVQYFVKLFFKDFYLKNYGLFLAQSDLGIDKAAVHKRRGLVSAGKPHHSYSVIEKLLRALYGSFYNKKREDNQFNTTHDEVALLQAME